MDIHSKKVHLIAVALCFVVAVLVVVLFPGLRKDESALLGTAGAFITLYGVIFAIIEVLRLKSASKLAEDEARRVFDSVVNLVTAREIIECQTKIEHAVEAIDENRLVPSASLCGIVKLYSQVFHEEVGKEESEHRRHRSTVESYYVSGRPKNEVSGNVKKAFLGIAGHLAQLQGSTKNFAEYKK
jgi:hypothetical protein